MSLLTFIKKFPNEQICRDYLAQNFFVVAQNNNLINFLTIINKVICSLHEIFS